MTLKKEDFRIEIASDGVYIAPKVKDAKRNERLDHVTKMTLRHSFNGDISYYSNNGTLGLSSTRFSKEALLEKAIAYYNWAG
tara:strand:- start:542 stop:787 length:246 start_codon:yes stop_codon:yes gene_type:complete